MGNEEQRTIILAYEAAETQAEDVEVNPEEENQGEATQARGAQGNQNQGKATQAQGNPEHSIHFDKQLEAHGLLLRLQEATGVLCRIKFRQKDDRKAYYAAGARLTGFASIPLIYESDVASAKQLKSKFGWIGYATYPRNPSAFENPLPLDKIIVHTTNNHLELLMPPSQGQGQQDLGEIERHAGLVAFREAEEKVSHTEDERQKQNEVVEEIEGRLVSMEQIPVITEADVSSICALKRKVGWAGNAIYPSSTVLKALSATVGVRPVLTAEQVRDLIGFGLFTPCGNATVC